MREAILWEKAEDRKVQCKACPHYCLIAPGKRGVCAVRENRDGTLMSLSYDRVSSMAVDPIEKKPLYHVLPGSKAFSFATPGCNLRCLHCQNADLSQEPRASRGSVSGRSVEPSALIEMALEEGCEVVSATYSEPTIFIELALDVAKLAREAGMLSTWVTNGYTSAETRALLMPLLDAANVDLKAFKNETYQKICGATLPPVLECIRDYHAHGVHVELTTLIIPGLNDGDDELRDIARFIADLDKAMPWHLSAFHPDYQMHDRPRTPVETLERAYQIGCDAGLLYVYTGNVQHGHGDTMCPGCHEVVIRRAGIWLAENRLKGNRCPKCGGTVHGLFGQAKAGKSN
jgi:pyruvate formate lyase activating enzyme